MYLIEGGLMAGQVDHRLDDLDAQILELIREVPRIGVLEMSRRLDVARGTVQSRLDKLIRRGVVTGFGPDVDPAAFGYDVLAFSTIEVVQGRIADVVEPLRAIPEVLEVHAIAGQGDLLARIVARSNEHLMDVLEQILQLAQIDRVSTAIALAAQVRYRTGPLVRAAAASA